MNDFLKRLHKLDTDDLVEKMRPDNVEFVRRPPDLPSQITPREIDIVKRGEAIAQVRQLEDYVTQLQKDNHNLQFKLSRCEDRCTMLNEERNKYRSDADKYRALVLELSSDMNALNLLSSRAQSTHERVLAIIESEAPPSEDRPPVSLTDQIDRAAEAVYRTPEKQEGSVNPVASMQEGPHTQSGQHDLPSRTGK